MKTSKALALGGLATGICLLSFLVFRGMTNVLNALIIPLVLGIFTFPMNKKETLAVFISLYIFSFFLFPLQLVFLASYIILSRFLVYMNKKDYSFKKSFIYMGTSLTVLFIFSIFMTDAIMGTRMSSIMVEVTGSITSYIVLVSFQAFVISAITSRIFMTLKKRMVSDLRG